jgi:hypothetical protein
MRTRFIVSLARPQIRVGLTVLFLFSSFSGLWLSNAEAAAPKPIDPTIQQTVLYFEESGHYLQDEFLQYWRSQGGYMEFGPPISEEFVDQNLGKTVQYFAKARFELVPLPLERGYRVELGAINREIVAAAQTTKPDDSLAAALKPLAKGVNNYSSKFFPQTGHSVSGAFLDRWLEANGLGNKRTVTQNEETYYPITRYGLPISEPYTFTLMGITYKAQDFERAKLLLQSDDSVLLANIGQFAPGLAEAPTERVANDLHAPVYNRRTVPHWVDVNLTTQTEVFMEGDMPVRRSLITSGEWQYETPIGSFPITSRVANEHMKNGKPGDPDYYDLKNVLYTQYFTPKGHALHYAWWRSEFGYRGSHGCINQDINTSRYAWDFLTIGDRVVIHY